MTKRRFPPPWTVEKIAGGLKVVNANGQSLAHVYGHADTRDFAKALTLDEARRIATNIAKLPALLGRVLINRQPNADLDAPTSDIGGKADMARTCQYVR